MAEWVGVQSQISAYFVFLVSIYVLLPEKLK